MNKSELVEALATKAELSKAAVAVSGNVTVTLEAATAAAIRTRVREIDVAFIGGFLFACGGAPDSFDVHMLVVRSYENSTEVLGMCELFGVVGNPRSVAIKRPSAKRSSPHMVVARSFARGGRARGGR